VPLRARLKEKRGAIFRKKEKTRAPLRARGHARVTENRSRATLCVKKTTRSGAFTALFTAPGCRDRCPWKKSLMTAATPLIYARCAAALSSGIRSLIKFSVMEPSRRRWPCRSSIHLIIENRRKFFSLRNNTPCGPKTGGGERRDERERDESDSRRGRRVKIIFAQKPSITVIGRL